MNNQAIGIFDSGLGGLTAVQEIKALLPNEDVIYFGDTARTPYGSKSIETINEFSEDIVAFLLARQVKVIGIACNTISSVSLPTLQKKFPEMTFIDIIQPMVKILPRLIEHDATVLVIGTEVTINSGMYQKKIATILPQVKIIAKACPIFVNLIEQGLSYSSIMEDAIHTYLDEIISRHHPDYLILGCTHYPLIAPLLKDFYPDIQLLNPAHAQASYLKQILDEKILTAEKGRIANYAFYASDLSDIFRKMIEQIMVGEQANILFKEKKL